MEEGRNEIESELMVAGPRVEIVVRKTGKKWIVADVYELSQIEIVGAPCEKP